MPVTIYSHRLGQSFQNETYKQDYLESNNGYDLYEDIASSCPEIEILSLFSDLLSHQNIKDLLRLFGHLILEVGVEKMVCYDALISDETSARLPSILIKNFIDAIRERENAHPIPLYFMPSGQLSDELDFSKIRTYLSQNITGKALFISEFVSSGQSLQGAKSILEQSGIQYESCCISKGYHDTNTYETIIGSYGSACLSLFYNRKDLTGVGKTKHDCPTIFSRRKVKRLRGYLDKELQEDQYIIRKIRKDIKQLASVLALYFTKKPNGPNQKISMDLQKRLMKVLGNAY